MAAEPCCRRFQWLTPRSAASDDMAFKIMFSGFFITKKDLPLQAGSLYANNDMIHGH
ncbi:hypothetical protein [Desulfosarcina ovata]|uniref:hypothetical protein n=1 Tax=Desulfosarcina ovata TaxID=83564 RepID=UPI0012D31C5F|nr:hypothetical protein [Desulfosarcina ovata]